MLMNFLKTDRGKIVISCILGLGLASLFRKVCKNDNCIIINAPPEEAIKDKVFKSEDKCVTYEKEETKCD